MIINTYSSTAEFNSAQWDSFHNGDFYFGYEFIKVVEQAAVSGSEFRFITFTDGGQPKGAVVLSKFQLHLDLLSGNPFPLPLIKKVMPGMLQLPVVCCGMPVSFGQNHFCVLDDAYMEAIVNATNKAIEKFVAEARCKLWAWKEFAPDFKGAKKLEAEQYFRFPSLPDAQICISESTLESYLGMFRSSYRRSLKKSIERLTSGDSGLTISVKPFAAEDVDAFYAGYLAVIDRTAVKLEIYPKKFFELLASTEVPVDTITIQSEQESMTGMLIPDANALNFILIAKEKKEYDSSLYAELVRAIVLYALERGFTLIKMGQTSYYAKMAAGGQPKPLEIFLKSNSKRINFVLSKFGSALFPEAQLPALNPLK
jgi:hypothetical protein